MNWDKAYASRRECLRKQVLRRILRQKPRVHIARVIPGFYASRPAPALTVSIRTSAGAGNEALPVPVPAQA